MKITILNPIAKYQENHILLIGILATIFGNLLGIYFNARYDGIFDVHVGNSNQNWYEPVLDNTINILVLTILLFIIGRIQNNKTRFIDLLNTVLISRIPIYIIALITMNPIFINATEKVILDLENSLNNLPVFELVLLTAISLISLLFLIWSIAIIFNGFKTSVNTKGKKYIYMIIIVLILSEIITKYLVSIY